MAKRKIYIINKKFQFRATFTVIGLIFIVVAILTALIGFNALDNNDKINRIVDIQDSIVQVLTSSDMSAADETQQRMSREMAKNHNENMQTLRKMIFQNQLLLWIIICIIIIQGIVLFFVLIRQTHRIAGPLYVMAEYMKQILNNKFPDKMRDLRQSDYLKETYDLFREMVYHLKEKADTKSIANAKPASGSKSKPKAKPKAK
ncbi:MAG: hypothetical protein JW982_14935 [Spirochaetes bacterium]|nr:hypothetical protein [Spirochaetota bacterium]